jgi:hypothetical protein
MGRFSLSYRFQHLQRQISTPKALSSIFWLRPNISDVAAATELCASLAACRGGPQAIGDLANWSLVAARFNFLFGASEFHSDWRPIFGAPRLNSISTSSYLHQETSHTASASQLHSSLRMGLRICFSHISFRAERKQAFRSPSF